MANAAKKCSKVQRWIRAAKRKGLVIGTVCVTTKDGTLRYSAMVPDHRVGRRPDDKFDDRNVDFY